MLDNKSTDPIEKLSNKLLKMAKYANTRKFTMKYDPTFNRKQFDYFIDDITNLCELTTETRGLLNDFPDIQPTACSETVDAAIFILLLSRTEGYAKNIIKQHSGQG